MIDLASYIRRFESVPPAVAALVKPLNDEEIRFKPEGEWSILEIVCHLADEEELDFRTRIRLTLQDPTQAWPPIDPEGWALKRKYNDQDLQVTLARFVRERSASIEWLESLVSPDWSRSYEHPSAGALMAGDILVSWAAHDALHLRQLAKRLFQLTRRDASGFSDRYAGSW